MKNRAKTRQQKQQTGIIIFYSYTEADRASRDQLATHLSQLKRDELIEEWYDQQILPGSDRGQAINQAICSADIILLLISADFLASDTCYDVEMQHALERHKRGEARVVPVLVRPCDWQHSPFVHLQCLPRNSKPITTWDNPDEALAAIAQELRRIIVQQRIPRPLLSDIQRQNRIRLLKRVHAIWIKGLLEQSLHQAAWIDLHLQERPDALQNPWRLEVQELNHAPHPLPIGTTIVQVYDDADGRLLILGEPGSGKTTLLLQIARILLDRAEADERSPMPVVFTLSSWAKLRQPLAQWLVEELKSKYQVPRQVGQQWIAVNQILPLLDGLDEMAEEARIACVQTISAYCSQYPRQMGTPLVVCCRTKEYQAVSLHLPLDLAASILPLTDEQIEAYLFSAKGQLEGLRQLLSDDAELKKLARRPLMLSIFTLAYQGMALRELSAEFTQEHALHVIFERYVTRMLTRRGMLQSWKQEEFLHWLHSLAKQLRQQQQTVFMLENLQPDWLPDSQQRLYWWSVRLFVGLLVGVVVGLLPSGSWTISVCLLLWGDTDQASGM